MIIFVIQLKLKEDILNKIQKLKEKHKLSFTNDITYHEKWSFNLSSLNLISLFFLYGVVIIILLFVLIRFTPLKSVFVDNENLYELKENLKENSKIIDSLEIKIDNRDVYLEDLKSILKGESFEDEKIDSSNFVSENYQPDFSKNVADSLLRLQIESEDKIEFSVVNKNNEIGFFMNPVHGIISRSLNKNEAHFGVDVVTQKDEPIKATLEGVVLFANWTSTEGNVIIVQHQDNIISVYKHCSVLLKELGDKVEVGDPIAIVGNSGKFTDGPHLHFELWQNGTALNPQEFISF